MAKSAPRSNQKIPEFLADGGEMGALIRAFDWSSTPLGPIAKWPQHLRVAIRMTLDSRFPIVVFWGPALTLLYNDPYAPLIGTKHPQALGQTARAVFPELWETIGPMLEKVLTKGEATWSDNLQLMMERGGILEECYFTFSYSPLRDVRGKVDGVFCAVMETTDRLLHQRRSRLLGDLGGRAAVAAATTSPIVAAGAVVDSLKHDRDDLPFAALYLLDDPQRRATLAAATAATASDSIDLREATDRAAVLSRVLADRQIALIDDPKKFFDEQFAAAQRAAAILIDGAVRPAALLVVGLSPHLPYDASYRDFLQQIANLIAAALTSAHASESIRDSRERLTVAVEAGELGIFEWNISRDRILWENRRMYELFGRDEAQGPLARGEFLRRIIEPGDIEKFEKSFAATGPGDHLHSIFRIRRPHEDAIRLLEFHGRFITNADNDRILIGVLADITEARAAEQAIEDSQLRLSIATSAAGFGVFEWDFANDRAIFENHRCYEIFGRPIDEGPINAAEFTEKFIHPDDLNRFMQDNAATMATGSGRSTLRIRRQNDGAIRWVEFFGTMPKNATGAPRGVVGVFVDITDQKRLAEEQRLTEERFRFAIESSGVGAWELNLATGAGSTTLQYRRCFGLEELSDHWTAESSLEWVHPEDRAEVLQAYRALATTGADLHREMRVIWHDGSVHWIEAHGGVSAWNDGKPLIIGGIIRDITHRKRTEHEFRVIQERARIATEAAGWGVWEWDPATDEAIWDDKIFELVGIPNTEKSFTSQQTLREVIYPKDRDALERALAEIARTGGVLHNVHRIVRRDTGEIRWQEIHARSVQRDGRSIFTGVLGDVTERERDRAILAERARLLDLSHDVILVRDPDDRITYWNHGAEATYGWTRAEALGQVSHELLRTRFPGSFDHIKQALARYGRWEGELEHRHKNGSTILVHSRWDADRAPDGRVRAILESNNDITLAKNAEKLRRRMAAIVEASDDAIISKDLDGTIVTWNPAAERIFGYTEPEVVGHSILKIVPPELHDFIRDEIERLARGQRVDHYETYGVRKDGCRIPMSVSVSPVRDENGDVIGASRIARDISDRREVEAERDRLLMREQIARGQAEEANRLKDDFLAVVSHELRAPLSTIAGWAHLLGTGKLDDAGRARAAEAIQRATDSQTQLINDLLDVSRIVAGKMRLNVRPLKLYEVIDQAVESVQAAADAKRVQLHIMADPEAAPLSGDPDRLQQVFWNLLSNAIKFTSTGGRVELRCERINSHVEITVSDTGIGIAREMLPYVFDRFRQAESASTRKYGGLGLGLAIVRHLVELHGGTVTADSLGEGQGSTFIVRLPTMVARRDLDGAHPSVGGSMFHDQIPSLAGVRVLAVDDEPDAREVIFEILRHAQADVRVASSASEALATLDEWQPDVIVSDVGMPMMDGYALMREIRTRFPEKTRTMRSLALTAYSRTEDRLRAFSAGYQMHLPKPVEPIELLTVIATLARHA